MGTIAGGQIETRVVVERASIAEGMLHAFSAIAYTVSARFLLFLGLLGAFALAVMSMLSQSVMSVVILSLYCILTILPLAILEMRSKARE